MNEVWASYRSTFATAGPNNALYGWGENSDGRLGVGDEVDRNAASPVCADAACTGQLTGVQDVVLQQDATLVLLDDGRVLGWGRADGLAIGGGHDRAAPGPVCLTPDPNVPGACTKPLTHIVALAGESSRGAATNSSGQLLVWGDGSGNQDGRQAGVRLTPVALPIDL